VALCEVSHPATAGHVNPTITQNIYVHWRDEQIHQASPEVEVCGKMLQKMQNPESVPIHRICCR
jgi:hypothetical protein